MLDKLVDFGSIDKIHIELWLILSLVVLIISLISNIFLLELSDFLQFVVINVELFSVEGRLVKLLFSESSAIWGLVADESKECFSSLWHKLNAFDFTALFKVGSQFSLCGCGWEVLDVQVASLLGVLES